MQRLYFKGEQKLAKSTDLVKMLKRIRVGEFYNQLNNKVLERAKLYKKKADKETEEMRFRHLDECCIQLDFSEPEE